MIHKCIYFYFYSEDKTLAMNLPSEIDQNELYSRLKTAAESGWDFSSKHYNNFGENTGNVFLIFQKT